MTPVSVPGVAKRARIAVNRSSPPVFSSKGHEHADAAHHQDRNPRHLPDGLFVVGHAQSRQHDGAR